MSSQNSRASVRMVKCIALPVLLSALMSRPVQGAEQPAPPTLFEHMASSSVTRGSIVVDAARPAKNTINPRLLGKFCEHLGSNIYNGMEAQILRNPTFGKWVFANGDSLIDGGTRAVTNTEEIKVLARQHAQHLGLPNPQALLDSYFSGLAFHWVRTGDNDVRCSPDVGPCGGRAQRVEVLKATAQQPAGIAQWIYLPLQRVRFFDYRIVARAVQPVEVGLTLSRIDAAGAATETVASATLSLQPSWETFTGQLQIEAAADLDVNACYRLALTASGPANLVLGRVLLYPHDQINGADPDVIRLLKQSGLPLLRWPGGNFVSGYRWRDGVGAVDTRPTLPNPAWDGLEYNLFGTHEYIAFCRAVGCEPMICVNSGDGTPEEAAAWVEYCNGSPDTSMGKLRAKNGSSEPFNVKLWEIGNELYGRWQVSWTTPAGNADRHRRFAEAMRAADPHIQILSCGSQEGPGSEWNKCLLTQGGKHVRCLTDHILTGGAVTTETDLDELHQAFLGYAAQVGAGYRAQRDLMLSAGIQDPHVAITELQLYAKPKAPDVGTLAGKIPTSSTMAEAQYFATLFNECARLEGFVELITHSATVNHGGGLRKTREKVWAKPVHHVHQMYAGFANAVPLPVRVTCGSYSTRGTYGEIQPQAKTPLLDVLAVRSSDRQQLLLMLVHRGRANESMEVTLQAAGLECSDEGEVVTLCGRSFSDENTLQSPDRIMPKRTTIAREGDCWRLTLMPFSVVRLTLQAR